MQSITNLRSTGFSRKILLVITIENLMREQCVEHGYKCWGVKAV